MQKILNIIFFSVSCLSLFGQHLEIEGKVRIDSMDLDNLSDSVVVRQSDGTLAVRQITTLSDFGITPSIKSQLNTGQMPLDINISGGLAYIVAQGNFGAGVFQIIDVSNPQNPAIISEITGIPAQSIYVSGLHVYLGDKNTESLKVIDVSEPADPKVVGTLALGSSVSSIFVSGLYVYVTCPGSNDLKIINVANPSTPYLVSDVVVGANPTDLFISAAHAYVVDADADKMVVISLSDHGDPTKVGELNIGTSPSGIYVSEGYAYLVDAGSNDFKIIDISEPSFPTVITNLPLNASTTNIFVAGRYSYLVDADGVMKVVDIQDPNTPILIANLDIGLSAYSVYVSGNYAYVLDQLGNKLKVVNLSGAEYTTMLAHDMEAGHLQVRNDLTTQGQLKVSGGLNVGNGGIYSDGGLGVSGSVIFFGKVGVGTADPETKLHVIGDMKITTSGNTNMIIDANEINTDSRLQIQNNSPEDVVIVSGGGKVGIGASDPSQVLDVNGNARFRTVDNLPPFGNPATALYMYDNGTLVLNSSDQRLKENLNPLQNVLQKLSGVHGYRYNYVSNLSEINEIGVIAQELEEAFPELVFTNAQTGYKGVHYEKITAVLIQAIKEQQTQILQLQKQLETLSKREESRAN